MVRKNLSIVAMACLALVAAGCAVLFLPPYLCGWLPGYPSALERAKYYWSPKVQFLRCNAILHDIDAAKDEYALAHGIASPDAPVTAGQIGLTPTVLQSLNFRCPAGGRYTINPLGSHPACSIHGDSLAWQEGDPYPTRERPAPPPRVVVPPPRQLKPADRIEVPAPDDGSGID